MNIYKGIIFSCIILLISNSAYSRSTKFQKVYYQQYNSALDSHTIMFQNSDTDNLSTSYDGGNAYEEAVTFLFFLKRSDTSAEIAANTSTAMSTTQDNTNGIFNYYKKFIPNLDGTSVNNKKHYVAYNLVKLACQTGDVWPWYRMDVKYFDCADEARYFYLKLHNNDTANACFIYDKDSSTITQSNGFITNTNKGVSTETYDFPIRPHEVFMGNGLLHTCT